MELVSVINFSGNFSLNVNIHPILRAFSERPAIFKRGLNSIPVHSKDELVTEIYSFPVKFEPLIHFSGSVLIEN